MADENWTDLTMVSAEGARVGFTTCRRCGAAVLLDPRDTLDEENSPTATHERFHDEGPGSQ